MAHPSAVAMKLTRHSLITHWVNNKMMRLPQILFTIYYLNWCSMSRRLHTWQMQTNTRHEPFLWKIYMNAVTAFFRFRRLSISILMSSVSSWLGWHHHQRHRVVWVWLWFKHLLNVEYDSPSPVCCPSSEGERIHFWTAIRHKWIFKCKANKPLT